MTNGKAVGMIVLALLVIIAIVAIVVITTKNQCKVPESDSCPIDAKTGEDSYPYCKDGLSEPVCGTAKDACGNVPTDGSCPEGYDCKYDADEEVYTWQCSSSGGGGGGGGGGETSCKLEDDGTLEYGVAYGTPGSYTITSIKKPVANYSRYIQITAAGTGATGCLLNKCKGKYTVSSPESDMFCMESDAGVQCTVSKQTPAYPKDIGKHKSPDTNAKWGIAYTYPGNGPYCKFMSCDSGYTTIDGTCKKSDCGPTPEHAISPTCKNGKWVVKSCETGYKPNKAKTACVKGTDKCTNAFGDPSNNCAVSTSDTGAIKHYLFESDTESDYIQHAIKSGKVAQSSDSKSLIMGEGSGDYPDPWSGCGKPTDPTLDGYARDGTTCVQTITHSTSRYYAPSQGDLPKGLPVGGCIMCDSVQCPPGMTPGDPSSKCSSFPDGCSTNYTATGGTVDDELTACSKNNNPPTGFSWGNTSDEVKPLTVDKITVTIGTKQVQDGFKEPFAGIREIKYLLLNTFSKDCKSIDITDEIKKVTAGQNIDLKAEVDGYLKIRTGYTTSSSRTHHTEQWQKISDLLTNPDTSGVISLNSRDNHHALSCKGSPIISSPC